MTTVLRGGRIRAARRLAAPIAAVGGAMAVLSMLLLPWFDLRGPGVLPPGSTGPIPDGAFLIYSSPHIGPSTSVGLLAGLAVPAGVLALTLRANAQLVARVVTVALTVALLLTMALEHTVADAGSLRDIVGDGVRAVTLPGFWVAVAGFVLFGLGVLVAPARAPRRRSTNHAIVTSAA